MYPFAIPFKFFEITFAIAVDKTLASVLGYVTSFFSYKFCIISNVSSGLILNLFVHSFCISAKLNRSGAFSFVLLFFISVTIAFLSFKDNMKFLASSSFLNPDSLYNLGDSNILEPSLTFHSALNDDSSLPNSPITL